MMSSINFDPKNMANAIKNKLRNCADCEFQTTEINGGNMSKGWKKIISKRKF